jgi:hypothetical protein
MWILGQSINCVDLHNSLLPSCDSSFVILLIPQSELISFTDDTASLNNQRPINCWLWIFWRHNEMINVLLRFSGIGRIDC